MTAKMLLNTLKTANPNAQVALGNTFGFRVTDFSAFAGPGRKADGIRIRTEADLPGFGQPPLLAGAMAKQLKGILQDLGIDHGSIRVFHGDKEILFASTPEENHGVIWLETEDDIDLESEIGALFKDANEDDTDELDFYMDLLDMGITPGKVAKHYDAEAAESMTRFCEEHGLL